MTGAEVQEAGEPRTRVTPTARRRTSLGEAAALGVVSSATTLLLTIIRSKVTAVILGPGGIGMSAEILQLVTLANLPGTTLTGPALVASVAETDARGDALGSARIIRTATVAVLLVSAVAAVTATLAGLWVLPSEWSRQAWPLTLLAGAAALVTATATVPQQVLTARGQLGKLAIVRLVSVIVGTALLIAGTVAFALTGQFIASLAGAFASLLVVRAVARHETPNDDRVGTFDTQFVRKAVKLGTTALIAGFATQGALFTIRQALERHGGAAENGQFQAAWSLGTMYFTFVLDSVGAYVFPRYAAAASTEALSREMDEATRFVFKLAPPAILCAIAFRGLVVHGLYSDRFENAVGLVGLTMVGDVAKAIGWVQAGPLLYRQRIRAFLVVELFASYGLAASALFGVPVWGLNAIGYGVIAVNCSYVLLSAFVVARSCGVAVRPSRIVGVLLATGAAFGTLQLTDAVPNSRWGVLALAILWWHKTGVIRASMQRIQRAIRSLGALRSARSSKPEAP